MLPDGCSYHPVKTGRMEDGLGECRSARSLFTHWCPCPAPFIYWVLAGRYVGVRGIQVTGRGTSYQHPASARLRIAMTVAPHMVAMAGISRSSRDARVWGTLVPAYLLSDGMYIGPYCSLTPLRLFYRGGFTCSKALVGTLI